jgi:deoxyribodipyrimidine photo-lyase
MGYGIHWFRRDLRVAGNLALQKQFKEHDGRVVGLFCFDHKFLDREDFSINRFQFFIETMKSLKKELKTLGSDLLVMDVGPDQAIDHLFKELQKNDRDLPDSFSWSRDYEPFARERDERIQDLVTGYGVEVFNERDHLIIEPHELEKGKGAGYQVYTPFSRKWLSIFEQQEFQDRLKPYKNGFTYLRKLRKGEQDKVFKLNWKKVFGSKLKIQDHLESFDNKNSSKVTVEMPKAGSLAAFDALESFKKRLDEYQDKRDIPSINGTSKLSMFVKNGSLTVGQIIAYFKLEAYQKKATGRDVYLSELIWREFYYHILYRHPRVEKESFNLKYRDLNWENDEKLFEAWKEGRTGFPIVDAGMRELKETGWMHNRVRMIVASFLTKDLLIDWRWGEKYFMETLLDGDLAPNNGGWQWAASTGCDPQPYFRIFNPWSQSKKFDPDGVYIKRFVPELKDVESKKLHEPGFVAAGYPNPIVEHKVQRERALNMYKALRT